MPVEVLPGSADLVIYRGDTLSQAFQFSYTGGAPVILPTSGWIAQVRSSHDATAILATFTVDSSGGALGRITLGLTATQTGALTSGSVWDLQQTTGAVVRTWLRGGVTIAKDVTRP